jgi:hypothetical protein
MSQAHHDRAAALVNGLLAILRISVTPAERRELEQYLRDELFDIERQIAADRGTAD